MSISGINRKLKAREFVFFTEETAMAALPAEFPRPERKVMWTILQLHYGNPLVHFELQPHVGRGVVELGLHFEGPPEFNDAWAGYIAGHAATVQPALGGEWELEEWTASWRRLHRVFRFEQLTADLGHEVADDLAKAIVTLQPLIAAAPFAAYVPPAPAARSAGKHAGRWRRKGK
ncbi:MAG: hypothetical protein HYX53_00070 [Chloroflexi bacterium]|nr:hypothetical protein [Chloroflexota bacterium]